MHFLDDRLVDFDVGLHIVFKNKEAHDKYQEAPLLIVNSERLNFVTKPDHFGLLLDRIESMRRHVSADGVGMSDVEEQGRHSRETEVFD
jgi:hypothetical protein